MNRRNFMKNSSVVGMTLAAAPAVQRRPAGDAFWPDGARMVVSLSMQMEAGAQPERGANGPWGVLDERYPDLPTLKWYEYGFKEGIPRLLDMYDRKKVKMKSHMVGLAVEKHPALAKEIVQRDRVADRGSLTAVMEDFIGYAQRHPGGVFLRKMEIAKFALSSPTTMREDGLA